MKRNKEEKLLIICEIGDKKQLRSRKALVHRELLKQKCITHQRKRLSVETKKKEQKT